MAENSKIEWCDHTVNLWWGCSKVHTGCDNCYAENTANRWGNDVWGNDKPRREVKSCFKDLNKYEKIGAESGIKQVVFIGSMMDIFEKPTPMIFSNGEPILATTTGGKIQVKTSEIRNLLFDLISRGKFDNLIFLFLTKRPPNISKYIPEKWKENPPKNVWFGTSISDQKTADDLVFSLIKNAPAKAKRFLSIEPQIDSISLTNIKLPNEHILNALTGNISFPYGQCKEYESQKINWIIQGGESGNKKRPFKTEWAYRLKSQCKNFGTPYFFKQIDKVRQIPPDLLIREKPF